MAARLLLASLLAAGSWWVAGSDSASACIPVRREPEQAARIGAEYSERIFIATVLESREPDDHHYIDILIFKVERYLKGDGPRYVTSVAEYEPCPPQFQEGGKYIIGTFGPLRLDTVSEAEAGARISLVESAVLERQGSLGSFSDDPLPAWGTATSAGAAIIVGAVMLLGVRRLAGN